MIGARTLTTLLRDTTGSFAIETAFAAPVLITLALGTFEIGSIVSRQQELQSAALEGETIALAVNQGATLEVSELEAIIRESVGLIGDQVKIERYYRCDAAEETVAEPVLCNAAGAEEGGDPAMSAATAEGETGEEVAEPIVSSYIRIRLKDTYTPVWTNFGVGEPLEFNVDRSVMLS